MMKDKNLVRIVVRSAIALGIVGTNLAAVLLQMTIPEWSMSAMLMVLGWYFGESISERISR